MSRYRAQPVIAVLENSHCLLRETYGTHTHTLCGQNDEFEYAKAGGFKVLTLETS
jgi:hypothetical protein